LSSVIIGEAYTSTGNPLAMAAGIETLDLLKSRKIYQDLGKKTVYLTEAISRSPEERVCPSRSINCSCRKHLSLNWWV